MQRVLLVCFLLILERGTVGQVSTSDGCKSVDDPMTQYTVAAPFTQNWTATSPGDRWRVNPGVGVGPATENTTGAWGQVGQWSDILVQKTNSPNDLTDITLKMVFTPSADEENDGIGLVLRYHNASRYYVCYVTSDQSGDCVTQRRDDSMLSIAKIDLSTPCQDGWRLVTQRFLDAPKPAYAMNVSTTMQFSIINNILSCTFDRNRDGVLNGSDPIVTYNDSVNPLPATNTKTGIYSYGWNGYISGTTSRFCPPSTAANIESLGSALLSVTNILFIVIGIMSLLLVIALIIIAIFVRRRRRHDSVPLASIGIGSSTPSITSSDSNWTIISNVEIKEELGKGNFGLVFRGIWQGTEVALKSLKATHQQDFFREALVLQKLRHPNIVQYLGLFEDGKTKYIVMEFLPFGSLSSFLQKPEAVTKFKSQHLIALAKHAAAGMMHLEEKRMVHRDLALRNLLLGTHEGGYIVKISDFGLSRSIESSYYRSDAEIPIKWSSPEVLEYGTHTSKSDVWSFGVVLWEMFSYGKLPYPEFTNDKTRAMVLQLYTMQPPSGCPDAIGELMNRCWAHKGDERPTFRTIFDTLDDIYQNQFESPTATQISTGSFQVAKVDHLYGSAPSRPNRVIKGSPSAIPVMPSASPMPSRSPTPLRPATPTQGRSPTPSRPDSPAPMGSASPHHGPPGRTMSSPKVNRVPSKKPMHDSGRDSGERSEHHRSKSSGAVRPYHGAQYDEDLADSSFYQDVYN